MDGFDNYRILITMKIDIDEVIIYKDGNDVNDITDLTLY